MNRCIKALLTAILIFVLSYSVNGVLGSELKALIVTGQNNHNCQASSPILKQILEKTGLFSVDMAISPAKGGDMNDFRPQFSKYNLVVIDYTGDNWSKGTNAAFIDYVKNGGGVVIYHAASSAFPLWKEYNLMTGIGGWNGRDEKSGPYVYYKDEKIIRDNSAGKAGSHGSQSSFEVINIDTQHPITKGLPGKWKHSKDELYGNLRGPAENLTVLSIAYSDPNLGGTGRNEPILMTVTFGKGRIFHTVLGHVMGKEPYPAAEDPGFIVTFQRGAEWAATGKVTQKVPDGFPIP